jgi:hypothetical protein
MKLFLVQDAMASFANSARALSFYEASVAQKLVQLVRTAQPLHQLNKNWGDGCLFWLVCSKYILIVLDSHHLSKISIIDHPHCTK